MNSRPHLLASVLSTVIWGFFSIPLQHLKAYPSEQILYYRIFVSLVVVLFSILLFRRKSIIADIELVKNASPEAKKQLLYQTLGASVCITVNWFAFIYVVNNVSLQSAAFAYMVCPILTALCGFWVFKESLSKLQWSAIAISAVSAVVLASAFYTDVLYSFFVASVYTIYLIIQKRMMPLNKFNFLGVQLIISSIFILPFYFSHPAPIPSTFDFWLHISIISVIFTIIPLVLSLWALVKLPASTVGIIIYLNPIIAFSLSFFYFHNTPNALQIFSYGLLLLAVIIFNKDNLLAIFPKKNTVAQ